MTKATARRAPLAVVAAATGCGLLARQHPCWDYTAHQLQGNVPGPLVSLLAHDRGAERTVRGNHAPVGYYWRRIGTPDPDIRRMRQYLDGHELTACPVAVAGDAAAPATTR